MSKLTIELYDMKLKINFPESLSSLHQQIKEQFCFSDSEMKGISIIYEHNLEEKSIQKEEDFTEFAKLNLYLIQLKINQKSELFKQSELDLKKENEKNKTEIEIKTKDLMNFRISTRYQKKCFLPINLNFNCILKSLIL